MDRLLTDSCKSGCRSWFRVPRNYCPPIVSEDYSPRVLRTRPIFLGPPSRISATVGGLGMIYEYNGVEEERLGININIPVLRLSKFVGTRSWSLWPASSIPRNFGVRLLSAIGNSSSSLLCPSYLT